MGKNAKKPVKPIRWKKLEDHSLIDWEPGESRTFSEYLGFTPPTKEGISGKHTFKNGDGKTVQCWGAKMLNDQLDGYPIGSPVKVEFLGKKKGQSGQQYKQFVVYGVDKE